MTSTLHLWENFNRSLATKGFLLPKDTPPCDGLYLPERFCHVSNNDHGLKRILFDIEGVSDFTLDGNGTTLTFLGEVLPIRIGRSQNITIKNLTIDWIRPFFSQGIITKSGEGWIEFQVDPALYPLRSDRGRLVAFDRQGWQTDMLWNMLPFDPATGMVASKIENWHLSRWHYATDLSDGHFRLEADFAQSSESALLPDMPVVLMHGHRAAPAIWIDESENVQIENVTIHHAPGMAIIGQLSHHIALKNTLVVPSAGRLFSSWVDAFHFVDCSGSLSLDGCVAQGQFDDAVNIHGTFFRILEKIGERGLRLQTVHPQRFGKNPAIPGTGFALYLHKSMQRLLVTRVCSTKVINQEICDIELKDAIPDFPPHALIGSRHNLDNNIQINNCVFGPNRGRGCLFNIEHKVLVENCHFTVSGSAIECIPDANYWWEGPPAQDVTIRNNTFENCGFGPCGSVLVRALPEFPDGSDPRTGAIREGSALTNTTSNHPVLGQIALLDNFIDHTAGSIFEVHNCEHFIVSGNHFSQNSPSSNLDDLENAHQTIISS